MDGGGALCCGRGGLCARGRQLQCRGHGERQQYGRCSGRFGGRCSGRCSCSKGLCQPGAADSCDDGNACTTETCDKAKGCVYSTMKDGVGCGAGKVCSGGVCGGS
ncbi:MAG: hypothetical protein H6747_13565 [Deltaproteobacteria bacterium]|nr:hypothetical protein [Deltaproteobacteria bacterium]